MQEYLVNSPVLQTLAITLIHFMWQGLFVAMLVAVLLFIISPARPVLRYVILSGAMVINLLLPLLTFFHLYQPITHSNGNQFSIIANEYFQYTLQYASSLSWYQQGVELFPYISMAWLSWVLILTFRLLLDVTQVQYLSKKETIDPEQPMLARFEQLAKQVGLTSVPQLIISLKAEVPMAIGWLKPVVLMPVKMLTGLNQAQLEMLLLHELAHIRRYDYLVNFLQTLVEILLFFHPAVWWISKQMRQEREYCSDDIAIFHCGNSVAYAHTLADTADLCRKHRHITIPTMAIAASGGDLKARVHRIVDHSCARNSNAGHWLAGFIIVMTFFVMVFKQFVYLPLPVEFKLFNTSTSHLAHQENPTNLAKFSIAQQLLMLKEISDTDKTPLMAIAKETSYVIESSSLPIVKIEKKAVTKPVKQMVISKPIVAKATTTVKVKPSEANDHIAQQVEALVVEKPAIASFNSRDNQGKKVSFSDIKNTISMPDNDNPYQQALVSLTLNKQVRENKIEQLLATKPQQSIQKFFSDSKQPLSLLANYSTKIRLFEDRYNPVKEENVNQLAKLNAKAIKVVDPKYPAVAKRNGIELDVLVNFTINIDGRVSDIEFESQNKLNYFKLSVAAAIRKWRFEPAKENNKPVQSTMSKIFSFRLR